MHSKLFICAFALALLCAGCAGGQGPAAAPAGPSPTIAALVPSPPPALAPAPAPRPAAPTSTPTPERPAPSATPRAGAVAAPAAGFAYLWPAYLPEGMAPSPQESRIARENEVGPDGIGFYVVTFNAGREKLIVGGGSTEALSLQGEQRQVTLQNGEATLTTSGDQRLLLYDVPQGTLFVYGIGVSESELLLTAESLLPIDVADMRARVGAP